MYLLVSQEVLIFAGIINVIKLSREYEKISLEKDAEICPIKCDLKIHKSTIQFTFRSRNA